MSEELPPRIEREAMNIGRRVAEGQASMEDLHELLDLHGFRPRIRDDDDEGPVLVCYPQDWEGEDGVDHDRIDDTDRAIERPLYGSGDRDWSEIAQDNQRVVDRVREEHGDVHAFNAQAFATFMNNHRARTIAHARQDDVNEFLNEYYPRNVWPSTQAANAVSSSVAIARRTADEQL